MSRPIPEDVRRLAGWRYSCDCGAEHRIGTKHVILESGAIDRLGDVIDELALPRRVWILADENTYGAAGERVTDVLRGRGIAFETTILASAADEYVGADEAALDRARRGVWHEAGLFVGIGSGVINDLSRLLAMEFSARYVVVPTAASMNGYGSPISAVIENGVKITKPSAATDAIVADLDVLSAAPVRLAQSGFGDLLAKNSSNADWYFSSLVAGTAYCDVLVSLVRRAAERTIGVAAKIKDRGPEAIRLLTEGLIAGAFAMDAAGITALASGGEHLIGHYIEMVAHEENTLPALHGEQVALGTLITAALYGMIRQVDPDAIDVDGLVDAYPDWPDREEQVRRQHGRLAEIVMAEARAQHISREAYRRRLKTIRRRWRELIRYGDEHVHGVEYIRNAYVSAGTPARASDLDISPELIAKAYRLARDIRNRYTILHLAGDLGLLEFLADEVLDRSGVLD